MADGKGTTQRKTTIKDVARAANVSPTSVSLVLHGDNSSRVSEKTRRKILEAVRTLNYRPNHQARSLVTRRSKLIGLAITTLFHPFYSEITQDIIEQAEAAGYGVLVSSYRGGIDDERRGINELLDRGVDGLIICSVLRKDPIINEMLKKSIPFVLINRNVAQGSHDLIPDYIGVDNEHGGYMAGEHILKMGHRRIACISGPQETSTGYDRQKGFLAALADHGGEFDPNLIRIGDFSRSAGREAIRKIQERKTEFTAVFAASDHMAVGVLDTLRASGLEVPRDVAVVGFDGTELAGMPGIDLTTVSQQREVMGRMGVDRLIEKLESDRTEADKITILKPRLIIRRTCGFSVMGSRYPDYW